MCAKLFWMGSNKVFRSNFQEFTTMALSAVEKQWNSMEAGCNYAILVLYILIQDIMGEKCIILLFSHNYTAI